METKTKLIIAASGLGVFIVALVALWIMASSTALVLTSLIVIVPVAGGLVAGGLFAMRYIIVTKDDHEDRKTQRLYQRADERGMFAAPNAMIDDGRLVGYTAQGYHLAQYEASRRPLVPHSLSYHGGNSTRQFEQAAQLPDMTMPEYTLPSIIKLSDVIADIPNGHLAYGQLTDGSLLTMPLTDGYHQLYQGDTRSGKTNAIDSLITQLHYQDVPLRLVLGDFKRELAATWRRSNKVESIETEPQYIAEMIQEMVHGKDGILDRYSIFEKVSNDSNRIIRNLTDYRSATQRNLSQTFIVVDEMNAVIAAAGKDKTPERSLQVALQTGAGAGVYILAGAQYLDSKTFGRSGSKQFVTRASFGAYDATAQRMIFNGAPIEDAQKSLLTGQQGRGLIKIVGEANPLAFQSLRVDESDILDAISIGANAVQPTYKVAETGDNSAPLHPSRTALAPEIAGCQYSTEQAEIVRRMKDKGRSKADTIELVFGLTKGGNEKYKNASAWYDEIVAKV